MRINEDYLDITAVEQSLDDIKVEQEAEFDGRFDIICHTYRLESLKSNSLQEMIMRANRIFDNSIFVKNHTPVEDNPFRSVIDPAICDPSRIQLSCYVNFNFRSAREILRFVNELIYVTFKKKTHNIDISFETETDSEEINNVFYSIDYETIFKNPQRDPISNFKSVYKLARILMPDTNTLPSLSKALNYDYVERFETHVLIGLKEKYNNRFRFKQIDNVNISHPLKLNLGSIEENFRSNDCILSKGNALANYVTNIKKIYNINELEKTQTVSRASYGVVLYAGFQHNFLNLYLDELPFSGNWTEGTISYMLTIVYPISMNPEECFKLVTL